MHEGKRPGGLTALAVFNFLGCANDFLSILSIVAMVVFFPKVIEKIEEEQEKQKAAAAAERPEEEEAPAEEHAKTKEEVQQEQAMNMLKAWGDIGYGALALWVVLLLALGMLLLLSGIGYIKQKKFLGRRLGNIYAILSLCTVAFEWNVAPMEAGLRGIGALIAVIYPVLTLILLNTTFKEDFVN